MALAGIILLALLVSGTTHFLSTRPWEIRKHFLSILEPTLPLMNGELYLTGDNWRPTIQQMSLITCKKLGVREWQRVGTLLGLLGLMNIQTQHQTNYEEQCYVVMQEIGTLLEGIGVMDIRPHYRGNWDKCRETSHRWLAIVSTLYDATWSLQALDDAQLKKLTLVVLIDLYIDSLFIPTTLLTPLFTCLSL